MLAIFVGEEFLWWRQQIPVKHWWPSICQAMWHRIPVTTVHLKSHTPWVVDGYSCGQEVPFVSSKMLSASELMTQVDKSLSWARLVYMSCHPSCRVTSWLLYKLLPRFLTSVVAHPAQVQMLMKASNTGLPLIFLPMHRSHLDYILISFILLNNNIRSPLVAAGDNLRIPVFGWVGACGQTSVCQWVGLWPCSNVSVSGDWWPHCSVSHLFTVWININQ